MTCRPWVNEERDQLLRQLAAGVDREHLWDQFMSAIDRHISRESTAAAKDFDEQCAVLRAQHKAEREAGVPDLHGSELAKRLRNTRLDRCRCRENELLMLQAAEEIMGLQAHIRKLEAAIKAHQAYEAQVQSLLAPTNRSRT